MADFMDDPNNLGLLSLGLRLMSTPGKFGTALGQSGLGAMGDIQQAKAAQQAARTRALQEQQMMMQLEELKRAQADKQKQAERQQAIDGAFRNSFESPATQALAGGGGPTVGNAQAMQGMQPRANQQRLIAELMQADPMAAYKMSLPKETKIKDYKAIRNPDGTVSYVGLTEDGKVVNTGAQPFEKAEVRDFGGYIGGIDPITGKATKYADKTMSATERDASARGWAGVKQGEARLSLDRQSRADGLATGGKAPTGYRFKADGTLEAIPGGPADIKAGAEGAKAEAKKASTIAQAQGVRETIKEAESLVGYSTAGFGSMLTKMPATDARNLSAKLETVKANLGFDRLQQMRDQSPTGGALGAVAVQELTALQSTVASLDQAQSPAELNAALKKIDGHYDRWLKIMGAEGDQPKSETPKVPGNLTPQEQTELAELRRMFQRGK